MPGLEDADAWVAGGVVDSSSAPPVFKWKKFWKKFMLKGACDTIDYGDLGLCQETQREVKAVLAQWEHQRRKLELAKMTQAQKQLGVRRTIHDTEGNGGEVRMMIPPYLYHKLGSHYGYACWNDADFCRNFLKYYPECRVKSVSEKPAIIVPGMAGYSTN